MKVHRYIYTRLPKTQSPTGKGGFQSAFLPADLITGKEVLEIESHIHFPDGVDPKGQTTILYKKIKGETYLILLRLRPLPEVKDEHGRGGVFLCEGFFFAEADWRPIPTVTPFIERIAPYQFPSMDALLDSPEVDRVNGRITPIEVDAPAVDVWNDEAEAPPGELLMAAYHVAQTQNRDLSVVLKGNPQEVTKAFEVCAVFMPESLRANLGWNDAFDGGKIFFSPLRLFGFSDIQPVTGRPAMFSEQGTQVIWPDEEIRSYGSPTDPFSHWLLEVSKNGRVQRQLLNEMHALSQAMVSKSPTGPEMPSDPEFERVNAAVIRKLYESAVVPMVGEDWTRKLLEGLDTHQQLSSWMRGFPMMEIAAGIEGLILHRGATPEIVAKAPEPRVVMVGSPNLQLLTAMWTLKAPNPEVMDAVPEAQAIQSLAVMLRRGPHHKAQLLPVLQHYLPLLPKLPNESRIRENLAEYIKAKVPDAFNYKNLPITTIAMNAGAFECIMEKPFDWYQLLDDWLKKTGGDENSWWVLVKLWELPKLENYQVLAAFVTGKTLPRDLERGSVGRKALLKAMREVHGLREKTLLDLGFGQDEINAAGGQKGFLSRLFSSLKR